MLNITLLALREFESKKSECRVSIYIRLLKKVERVMKKSVMVLVMIGMVGELVKELNAWLLKN